MGGRRDNGETMAPYAAALYENYMRVVYGTLCGDGKSEQSTRQYIRDRQKEVEGRRSGKRFLISGAMKAIQKSRESKKPRLVAVNQYQMMWGE